MIIEIYRDAKGEFRWRLKIKNKTVAFSAMGYKTHAVVAKSVTKLFAAAKVQDLTMQTVGKGSRL